MGYLPHTDTRSARPRPCDQGTGTHTGALRPAMAGVALREAGQVGDIVHIGVDGKWGVKALRPLRLSTLYSGRTTLLATSTQPALSRQWSPPLPFWLRLLSGACVERSSPTAPGGQVATSFETAGSCRKSFTPWTQAPEDTVAQGVGDLRGLRLALAAVRRRQRVTRGGRQKLRQAMEGGPQSRRSPRRNQLLRRQPGDQHGTGSGLSRSHDIGGSAVAMLRLPHRPSLQGAARRTAPKENSKGQNLSP